MTNRKSSSFDVAELYRQYPLLRPLMGTSPEAEAAWDAVFNVSPDSMHRILADIIKQEYAKPGRVGQRPMPTEAEVDTEALLYGSTNTRPIREVLPELMNGESLRKFAKRVHMTHVQVHRIIQGEYYPDADQIRRIARATGKSPAFFIEYRKMVMVAAFLHLIETSPDIATTLFARYVEIRRKAA